MLHSPLYSSHLRYLYQFSSQYQPSEECSIRHWRRNVLTLGAFSVVVVASSLKVFEEKKLEILLPIPNETQQT